MRLLYPKTPSRQLLCRVVLVASGAMAPPTSAKTAQGASGRHHAATGVGGATGPPPLQPGWGAIAAGQGGGSSSSSSLRPLPVLHHSHCPRRPWMIRCRRVSRRPSEGGGPPASSSDFKARSMSSSLTVEPSGNWRSEGTCGTALAADAQDASKARFSWLVIAGSLTMSSGCPKTDSVSKYPVQ